MNEWKKLMQTKEGSARILSSLPESRGEDIPFCLVYLDLDPPDALFKENLSRLVNEPLCFRFLREKPGSVWHITEEIWNRGTREKERQEECSRADQWLAAALRGGNRGVLLHLDDIQVSGRLALLLRGRMKKGGVMVLPHVEDLLSGHAILSLWNEDHLATEQIRPSFFSVSGSGKADFRNRQPDEIESRQLLQLFIAWGAVIETVQGKSRSFLAGADEMRKRKSSLPFLNARQSV
jgi:hypothetical protein